MNLEGNLACVTIYEFVDIEPIKCIQSLPVVMTKINSTSTVDGNKMCRT